MHRILSSKSRNKGLQCYDWRKNLFDQPVKCSVRAYDNIQKTETGQGDDYRTGCLLGYNSFKSYCKMVVIDLSKQQELDASPKAI